VTFTLAGFNKQERDDVVLTSGFTASVNGTMTVGQLTETIVVAGVTPTVDVQNSREVITLPGDRIRDMPTSRNVNSLLELTPGISSQYTTSTAQSPFGAPGVCVGGVGVFCNPGISGFNIGDRGTALDQSNMAQGRVLVDGVVVNSGGSEAGDQLLGSVAASVGASILLALIARDLRTAMSSGGLMIAVPLSLTGLCVALVPGVGRFAVLGLLLFALGIGSVYGGLRWLTYERYVP